MGSQHDKKRKAGPVFGNSTPSVGQTRPPPPQNAPTGPGHDALFGGKIDERPVMFERFHGRLGDQHVHAGLDRILGNLKVGVVCEMESDVCLVVIRSSQIRRRHTRRSHHQRQQEREHHTRRKDGDHGSGLHAGQRVLLGKPQGDHRFV